MPPWDMPTKRCPRCEEAKPTDDFGKNRSMRDGLQGWCRSCTAERAKAYRAANREALTEKNRAWRAANPDKVTAHVVTHREYQKQYYAANKGVIQDKNRAYQEANKDRITAYRNEWSRINGSGHRARARRFGVKYASISKREIFERDAWICQLCGDPVDREAAWPDLSCATLDHIVPMSKGGDHVESNVWLAHFRCNLTKRDQ